jgi:hypothetical protein
MAVSASKEIIGTILELALSSKATDKVAESADNESSSHSLVSSSIV